MTRLLLIALLLLSSAPAYAEWMEIAKGESAGGHTTYVDPDTIRRKGNLVKIWQLREYKTLQTVANISYLSESHQFECDCAEERVHMLASVYYSRNMGTGSSVYSDSDETKWIPIAPGSMGQILWKLVCE